MASHIQKSSEVLTLEDGYLRYIEHWPKKTRNLKTTLFHYLLPYQGFEFDLAVTVGEQIRGPKLDQAWGYARRVKLEDLYEIERVLTWQAEVFDSVNASSAVRRPNRHYLKHFLTWCKNEGYLKPKQTESWSISHSMPDHHKGKIHRRGSKESNTILKRDPLIEYGADLKALSDSTKLDFELYSAFWTDFNYGGTRPIPDAVEKKTHSDNVLRLSFIIGFLTLDKIDFYRKMIERAQIRKEKNPSYESDWLIVGIEPPYWLKEIQERYPPRPVNTIVFGNLIPLVELRPSQLIEKSEQPSHDDSEDLLVKLQQELQQQNATLSFDLTIELGQALLKNQKFLEEFQKLNKISARAEAEEQAQVLMKVACENTRKLLKDFFRWLQYHHNPIDNPDGYRISPQYKTGFCNAMMSLAKFRYREITNPRHRTDYEDIELIIELRNLRTEEFNAPFKANAVDPLQRDPTWRELGQVLRELLESCAPRYKIKANTDNKNYGKMRAQTSVASDFQKYLIMMFFRLVAPERQHVVRELKQHDTLKLCWINWETQQYIEAPWSKKNKRYEAFYNPKKRLYYLDDKDAKDGKGNFIENPQGKPFSWFVFLDASQTKIDRDNAYQIPKIYNSELEAWLNGREDYSGAWFNWPPLKGTKKSKWNKHQYHWCGYIDTEKNRLAGFRATFNPKHDYVFTQQNGKPFSMSNFCRLYDAILWGYLGIRSHPHAVRRSVTGHFKVKGMTDAERESLAKLKSHSPKMQDSAAYNGLTDLEKTARASQMIAKDFLEEYGLDQDLYGLVDYRQNV